MASLAAALLAHAAFFWGAVWLVDAPASAFTAWWLCYLAGVSFLAAGVGRGMGRLQLSVQASLAVIGYAGLLAVIFWGANMALDVLGNSVSTRRVPAASRTGLPLHLLLVPGVASVGLAGVAAGLMSRGRTWRSPARGRRTGAPASRDAARPPSPNGPD